MNRIEVKILRIPIPKHRYFMGIGSKDWAFQAVKILSQIEPENEGAELDCIDRNPKRTIIRLHSLGKRYGFRVACRTTHQDKVVVWVKKPGIDKHILDLWYDEKPTGC